MKGLELKDMRIGNYFTHDLDAVQWDFDMMRNLEFEDEWIGEGIRLNEEWLVKRMGFRKRKVQSGYQYHLNISQYFRITIRQDFHVYLPYNYPSGFHGYVHELQNLYYYLKNEEMPIDEL